MSLKNFKLLTRSDFCKMFPPLTIKKIDSGEEKLEAEKFRSCYPVKFSWVAGLVVALLGIVDVFKSNLKGKHFGAWWWIGFVGQHVREEDSMHSTQISDLSTRLSHWDYILEE